MAILIADSDEAIDPDQAGKLAAVAQAHAKPTLIEFPNAAQPLQGNTT
jgi:hypothetical protein